MYNFSRLLAFAAAGALALGLYGCGDGSTAVADSTPAATASTPVPAATPSPSTPAPGSTAAETTVVTISGVVATGAACVNAPVRFPGLTTIPTDVRTAKDGSYSATVAIPASAAGKPQVLNADCENDAGGTDTLASIMASPASGTVNVNPFTNLICALVSRSGDPKQCGTGLIDGVVTVNVGDIKAKVAQLKEILLPVITALAIDVFDPIAGPAIANGTGFDRLQDMARISITPQEDGTSSIEIRLKIKNTNETDSQPVIRFTNLTATDAIKLANRIDSVSVQDVRIAGNLMIPTGTSALIADLVSRMNACYALPTTARWNGRVLAPACTAIFVNGDVSNYMENGLDGLAAVLGPLLGTTFSDSPLTGLLIDPKDVQFSMGTYQYLRPNGLYGFSARKTTPGSTVKSVTFNAQTGTDGKLGLSGNQYRYEATVIPFAERHTFLNQIESSYLSTGIDISVPLQVKAGAPVTKVVLTPPPNKITTNPASFTLLPGADYMALPMQDALLNALPTPTASTYLRLRSEYVDKAANANSRHPSRREFGQHFANDIAESALLQLSAGDVWTLDFYVGNAGTPDATQHYRLPARPYTIAELRAQALPDLQAPTKQFLQSLLIHDEPGVPGITPLSGLPELEVRWTTTPEVILPRVFGLTAPIESSGNIFFSDSLDFKDRFFGSLSDKRVVPCRNGSNGDLHCTQEGRYASGAILHGVELQKALPDRRMLVHHFSVLQLLP